MTIGLLPEKEVRLYTFPPLMTDLEERMNSTQINLQMALTREEL